MIAANTQKRLVQLQKKAVLRRVGQGCGSTWEAHLGGQCVPKLCRYCAQGLIRRTERPAPPMPPPSKQDEPNPLEAWV